MKNKKLQHIILKNAEHNNVKILNWLKIIIIYIILFLNN